MLKRIVKAVMIGRGIGSSMTDSTHKTHNNPPQSKKGKPKAEAIIQWKLNYHDMTLKEVATNLRCNYDYVREVWSKYVKHEITKSGKPTKRGRPPLPFSVHAWFFWSQVPTDWYVRCPVGVSDNQNRQKVFRDRLFTFVIYDSGKAYVYPNFPKLGDKWRVALRGWLSGWCEPEPHGVAGADLFLESLQKVGKVHYAFDGSGTVAEKLKGLKVNLKGFGKFGVDETPHGTSYEVEPDPDLLDAGKHIKSQGDKIIEIHESLELMRRGSLDFNSRMVNLENLQVRLTASVESLVSELRLSRKSRWKFW